MPPSTQTHGLEEDGTYITMRVRVKNSLLVPDSMGKTKLDELEPDLVPKGSNSPNAPVLITALVDPDPIPGYQPISTVVQVPEEQARDLETLNRDYSPTFLPKGSFVLTQAQVDEHAREQQQLGARTALPPGHQAKLMDSPLGLKVEKARDQMATTLGQLGSTSGALGIAANLGLPAQAAAPLALATAPLQILGPTGSLSTIAKLENQKAALWEMVKADNPNADPLKVVVDMNPHTQLPITLEEALSNLQGMQKVQQARTLGSALLLGAGAAALGGWGTAATTLALGSLASPLADALPTFDQLGKVRQRKKELQNLWQERVAEAGRAGASDESARLQANQSVIEVQVPILQADGQPVGFEARQIPLSQAIGHVDNQQRLLTLGGVGAVVQAGSLVAMGLGCPILLAVGASVALPLAARGALYPAETWQALKNLPSQVWEGIQAVAEAIAQKLGLAPAQPAQPMSGAQEKLFQALEKIGKEDLQLAQALQSSLQALYRPPSTPEQQAAALEAGPLHQAQLAELQSRFPQLAMDFEQSLQGLIREAGGNEPPATWKF